jgi:hypothetical protein
LGSLDVTRGDPMPSQFAETACQPTDIMQNMYKKDIITNKTCFNHGKSIKKRVQTSSTKACMPCPIYYFA